MVQCPPSRHTEAGIRFSEGFRQGWGFPYRGSFRHTLGNHYRKEAFRKIRPRCQSAETGRDIFRRGYDRRGYRAGNPPGYRIFDPKAPCAAVSLRGQREPRAYRGGGTGRRLPQGARGAIAAGFVRGVGRRVRARGPGRRELPYFYREAQGGIDGVAVQDAERIADRPPGSPAELDFGNRQGRARRAAAFRAHPPRAALAVQLGDPVGVRDQLGWTENREHGILRVFRVGNVGSAGPNVKRAGDVGHPFAVRIIRELRKNFDLWAFFATMPPPGELLKWLKRRVC